MLIRFILGVRKIQRTEHRKQMTACDELSRVEDKGRTVSAFCHLTSVICYPTLETIVITTVVTLLWNMSIEPISKIVDQGSPLKSGISHLDSINN